VLVKYSITRFMDQLCSCRFTVTRRELLVEPDLLTRAPVLTSGISADLICSIFSFLLSSLWTIVFFLSIVVSVRRFSTYDYHCGISILLNCLHKSNFSFLHSTLWTIVCLSAHCFVCDCDRTVVAFISACLVQFLRNDIL